MEATIIYPHQLFPPKTHPALTPGRVVYLVEEPLLLTYNPAHVQRLLLHRLSLQAYRSELEAAGYEVRYLEISGLADSTVVFSRLARDGVHVVHVVDTTDEYLERAIAVGVKAHGFDAHRYESPLFILPKAEAAERFLASKRFMARFYERLRGDTGYLMEPSGTPQGGRFSFDVDNRQKLPKQIDLPSDIEWLHGPEIHNALAWLETFQSERYGKAKVWVPYTRAGAEKFLKEFLRARFASFGPYEDALTIRHTRLFHSTLSPLINIGLLDPRQVLDTAIAYAQQHTVPLNSLEGFVRQILGWREFIRASYEIDGGTMRTKNFFNHTRTLTPPLWTGDTGIFPVDHAIQTALTYGYTHHIERLMVLGNWLLLTRTHPHEVYRWFMGMYVDAYDWVMVPNVYGMSQFADGGSFATKPYISGASYLKKMSDYPKGDWEDTWTALYWTFIQDHHDVFTKNHRLSMMPKLLEKMSPAVRTKHATLAKQYLS